MKRWLLKRAYQSADSVVAVSQGVRQAAVELFDLPSEKTRTLYNFFDLERIDRLMAEPLPPDELRSADRFEIVAAGRLHPQKGFAFLLEAIRELVQNSFLEQARLIATSAHTGAGLPELKAALAEVCHHVEARSGRE